MGLGSFLVESLGRVSGLWSNILRVGDVSSFGLVVGKVFGGIVGFKVGRGVISVFGLTIAWARVLCLGCILGY